MKSACPHIFNDYKPTNIFNITFIEETGALGVLKEGEKEGLLVNNRKKRERKRKV